MKIKKSNFQGNENPKGFSRFAKKQTLLKEQTMEKDYQKRLIKRLNERKSLHNLLISKRNLLQEIKTDIESIEVKINNLDCKISVLTLTEKQG